MGKNWRKKWGFAFCLIALCVVFWLIGIQAALLSSHSREIQAGRQEASVAKSTTSSRKFEVRVQNKILSDPIEPIESKYEALLDEHHLQGRNKELSSLFTQTSQGRKLLHVVTLLDFGPAVQMAEGIYFAEELEALKSKPNEALIEIQSAAPKLEKSFAHEYQFLVQLAGKLNVNASEKQQFLSDELQRSSQVVATNELSTFNCVTVLTVLMNQSQADGTKGGVESALRRALAVAKDPAIRQVLVSTYEGKDPEGAKGLRLEFGI